MYRNYAGVDITITTVPSRDSLLTPFGKATLRDRYLSPGESYQDLFARVSAWYSDDQAMADRVYDYMSLLWFMPSTPELSNGGTGRGLPISCFLQDTPDDMLGIANAWHESVMLSSKGGGLGVSYNGVRSIDEDVGLVGQTSGIIPFIKVMDSITLAVSQGSLRRGSAAVYIDMDHPEIEEFLDIRRVKGDLNRRSRNIHHGVMIPDAFMEAVKADAQWELKSPKTGLVRKTVGARYLWEKLLLSRLEEGEPYIVWTDTVDRKRPEVYKALGLKVKQSNLCSEIALATGIDHLGKNRTAVCCLASLNQATQDQWFRNEQFIKDVAKFQDNVLTDFITKSEGIPGFEHARYSAMRERAIGIGVMGFHTYLQINRIPFESALAHAVNLRLWKWLDMVGKKINVELAEERGSCPDALEAGIMARFSHMFAVAPTASISIICGSPSPGVEAWPANIFTQKTLSGSFAVRNAELETVIRRHASIRSGQFPDASDQEFAYMVASFEKQAWDQIENDEGSVKNLTFLSQDERDVFKTFMELDQKWVVSHMAARAPYIDQMASNNLSLPGDVHKKDLHELHMKAWRDGVPSLYYLRSKSLQRGGKVSHMAGELPQPGTPHEIVVVDRGEALDFIADVTHDGAAESNKYHECLACQ